MPIDFDTLEVAARAELAPPLERLAGTLQVWTMFVVAHEIGNELLETRSSQSIWAKHALTLAMAVEYSKPWSGNREGTLRSLDKGFLRSIEDDPRHSELCDYRNKGAAHLDQDVQPLKLTLEGAALTNYPPPPRQFSQLFVAARARASASIALGLDLDDDIRQLLEHVRRARDTTCDEIRVAASAVQEAAWAHAPILHRLGDLVTLVHADSTGDGERRMPDMTELATPGRPERLTIHGRCFSGFVISWEGVSTAGDNLSIEGDGFRINSQRIGHEQVTFTVSFTDVQNGWNP